jgi:hypothetical protein
MRKAMQEKVVKEQQAQKLSEYKQIGDRLFEKWSKDSGIGQGMDKLMEKDERKARGLSIMLENQEKHLNRLTETQISNVFQTTPENVLRVVRLGYPNSVRGEIFHDYPMVTARDSIYYLSPVYASTARGSTADNVTHESASYRYASEVEQDTLVTSDDTTFTGSDSDALPNAPLRRFSIRVYVDNIPVGNDDGSGNITGNITGYVIDTGSIDYDTGDISVTFDSAQTGSTVVVEYNFDSEQTYDEIYSVELQLRDYQLRAKPYPLYVSWSKMTELLLGTTLDIDAEEALLTGAGDELKKSLDFEAVRLAYKYAKRNTQSTFDADFAAAGADSAVNHAQYLTRTITEMGQTIYKAVQRGGISHLVVGSDVYSYLTLHDKFTEDGSQPAVGIYRVGTLLGKPVYVAPANIIPADEAIGVWRNPQENNDMAITFGSLIPLYQTQTLEYREAYKEAGLYHFGDNKVLNSKYIVPMKINNLD